VTGVAIIGRSAFGASCVFATAVLQAPEGPTAAQSRPAYYTSVWQIDPGSLTDPAEPLKNGQLIFKTAVIPSRSYILQGNVSAANGQIMLPKGTALMGLEGTRSFGCSLEAVKGTALTQLTLKKARVHLCLVDMDSDQKFDHGFFVSSIAKYFLRQEGLVPQNAESITPVSFMPQDPKLLPTTMQLYVFFDKNAGRFGSFNIASTVGPMWQDNGGWANVNEGYHYAPFKREDFPTKTTVYGAELALDEVIDGRLKIRILKSPQKGTIMVGIPKER
jgi:hypothetical protein